MMTKVEQQSAARDFAEKWQGHGDEKQDSQRFWIELLQKVYGVEDPASFVRFETRVKLSHTSFIDVMIPATHTMIEQKSMGKDLNAPIKQSDGTFLKPSEQAKRYAAALPYSERPRWIISCNFQQFQIFDMERPNDDPQIVELANLPTEYYRLQFMVDVKDSHIQKEMEVSKSAGDLVARLYNALLPLYQKAGVLTGSIYYFLKLRTPETLMRQGFIRFSDIRHHHIMHTVSGTFPIDPAVLPRTDRAAD